MRNLFYSFSSVTSINLSNFQTEKLSHMSKMFYSWEKLSYLDISSFKANSTNTTLFDENLPDNGIIIIDKIFDL